MNKLTTILLGISLCFSFAGCGSDVAEEYITVIKSYDVAYLKGTFGIDQIEETEIIKVSKYEWVKLGHWQAKSANGNLVFKPADADSAKIIHEYMEGR